MISHNLRQVFDLVDKIWVFRQGKIVGSVDTSTTNSNSSITYHWDTTKSRRRIKFHMKILYLIIK